MDFLMFPNLFEFFLNDLVKFSNYFEIIMNEFEMNEILYI